MSLKEKYKHNPLLATVIVTEDSGTLIRMPNGDILPCVILTRVTDQIDNTPEVIIKLKCNLEFTEHSPNVQT